MNLFILTTATDKTAAAVVSLTDATPVTEISQLMLGDSEPLTVKFTDGTAAPAWAGDPTYQLEIALGNLDVTGLLEYSTASDFDPITGGWSGRLNLNTQRLRDAMALDVGSAVNWTRYPAESRFARPRSNLGWMWLQLRVVDPNGEKVTYAILRVPVFNRVLNNPPVENPALSGVLQQDLIDAEDIVWNVARGAWALVTITAARNFLNPDNRQNGQTLILEVSNPDVFEPTFGDAFIWPLPDGTPPVPVGTKQIYSFACSGGVIYASMIDFP